MGQIAIKAQLTSAADSEREREARTQQAVVTLFACGSATEISFTYIQSTFKDFAERLESDVPIDPNEVRTAMRLHSFFESMKSLGY